MILVRFVRTFPSICIFNVYISVVQSSSTTLPALNAHLVTGRHPLQVEPQRTAYNITKRQKIIIIIITCCYKWTRQRFTIHDSLLHLLLLRSTRFLFSSSLGLPRTHHRIIEEHLNTIEYRQINSEYSYDILHPVILQC